MWHQWFNHNFTKLRDYFLCAKKTKIMTLFNNSSPYSAILEMITYLCNVCTRICCLHFDLNVNNVSAYIHCLRMWYRGLQARQGPTHWVHSDRAQVFFFFFTDWARVGLSSFSLSPFIVPIYVQSTHGYCMKYWLYYKYYTSPTHIRTH